MCSKCEECDAKIAHFRRLARQVADNLFNERVDELIAEMITERGRSCDDKSGSPSAK